MRRERRGRRVMTLVAHAQHAGHGQKTAQPTAITLWRLPHKRSSRLHHRYPAPPASRFAGPSQLPPVPLFTHLGSFRRRYATQRRIPFHTHYPALRFTCGHTTVAPSTRGRPPDWGRVLHATIAIAWPGQDCTRCRMGTLRDPQLHFSTTARALYHHVGRTRTAAARCPYRHVVGMIAVHGAP